MNTKVLYFATLIIGAAIGSVSTFACVKGYYERRAQEEIDSVKERFSRVKETVNTKKESESPKQEKTLDDSKESWYDKVLQKENYISSSHDKHSKEVFPSPYIIHPSDVDQSLDYDLINLTYYNNDILTNMDGEIVTDRENLVGLNFVDHFGEFEGDIVFVRNEKLKCDFEITYDERNYEDARNYI